MSSITVPVNPSLTIIMGGGNRGGGGQGWGEE